MAKYYGAIGFGVQVENPPGSGIYKEEIQERKYTGDILRSSIKNENGEYLNDNFNVDNQISIVADSFALENTHIMKYVTFLKAKWKIRNISVSFPRLILTVGGVYNDESRASVISSEIT